jgi:hypothetical protein
LGTFVFHLPGPLAVTGFKIALPAGGGNTYSRGAGLSSGSVAGTNALGTEITGLVEGNWYAVECAGGPWWADETERYECYSFQLSNGGGFSGAVGLAISNDIPVMLTTPPVFCVSVEVLTYYYACTYFQATTPSIWFRCMDPGAFDNNRESLGWILRSAIVTPLRKATSLSAAIHNICA